MKQEKTVANIGSETRSLGNPRQIMEFGSILRNYITQNQLSTKIKGKEYANVDGWKFAGANFGLTAIAKEPVRISKPDQFIHIVYANVNKVKDGRSWIEEVVIYASTIWHEKLISELKERNKISRELHKEYFAFDCAVDIVRVDTGQIVGAGFASCSNLELTKILFDEYAVKSMAQTRAIGKGFRNLLGYVMNSAGVESTPAEEMEEVANMVTESKKKPITRENLEKAKILIKEKKLTIESVQETFFLTDDDLMFLKEVDNPRGNGQL